MKYFTNRDKSELKDYLYYGHAHDATIETIEYIFKDEYNKDRLNINTINTYDKIRVRYIIKDLESVFTIKKHELEDNDVILGVYVEDNISNLNDYYKNYDLKCDEYLYLVIQMKSFDELHIICREIYIIEEKI